MAVSLKTACSLLLCVCVSGNLFCPKGCESCAFGYCNKCDDGYYKKGDGNCSRCSTNCQVCLSDNKCDKCDTGYYLQRKDNNEYICQSCPEGCSTCSSLDCFRCDIGYFQNNNTCRKCSSGCAICKSENECRKCNDGYKQSGTSCTKCPEKFYSHESSCLSCPRNCALCSKLDECTKCEPGFFGSLCTQKCSSGCVGNVCNQSNGQCHCKENFVGETCDLCAPGKYGFTCNLDCPKTCLTCDSYENCTACSTGYFGNACEKECSKGCLWKICDKTGTCFGCKPGYFGDICDQTCPVGCIENNCFRKTGDCHKCKAYFKRPSCTQCEDGKWGEDCIMDCPDSCRSCLSPTQCTRCKDGYYGEACEKNCSNTCPLKLCEQITGICSENCTNMFMGQHCDQCIKGRYGKDNCSAECPNNCYNNVCDMIDGRCNEGCQQKFYGPNCDMPCPESCKLCSSNTSCKECAVGFWGGYCQNQCPKNCLNNTCLPDGKCALCLSGYYGNECNVNCTKNVLGSKCNMSEMPTEDDSFLTNNVGSMVLLAAVVVLVSAVTITVILLVKNRKKQKCEQRLGDVTNSQVRKACKQREQGGIVCTKPNTMQKQLALVDKNRNTARAENVPTTSENKTYQYDSENGAAYANIEMKRISSGFAARLQNWQTEDKTIDEFDIEQEFVDHIYYNADEVMKRRIPIYKLWEFVQNKSRISYIEEFQQLPEGLIKPYTHSQKKKNFLKNRYRGIYPYDSKRVILQNLESNYINASYIDGFRKKKAYIASMGPTIKQMGEDFLPFWHMLWQENVSTIVMLTNLRESGVQKCDKYWPENGFCELYGGVKVTCQSEEVYANFTARLFSVEKTDKRTVHHMHFTAWPDKSTPENASSLIEFWEKVNDKVTSEDGPILVHCSAGVGRTGTFIALDMLANEGMSEGHVDIFACVRNLREERVSMVQTVDQYIFLHEALAQLLCPDKEVTI